MKPNRVIDPRVLLLCLFLMPALAVSAAEEFAERIVVTEVEIPVRVLVDGRPLRGLDADDFELFDRGVRQEILSFEEMDLAIAGEKVEVGDPVSKIIEEGRSYSLIVLSASKKVGLKRLFGTSVASKVLEKAHNSVMIVR